MGGDVLLQALGSVAQLLTQLKELSPRVGEAPSVDPVLRDDNALLNLAQLHPQVVGDGRRRLWRPGHMSPRPATASRQLPCHSTCVAAMLGQ